MQRKIMALALAACFVQAPAYAQSAADLAGIRQQLDAMKRNYESRIEALEKRLAEAEARAGSA
jgi:predicted porin